MADKKISQLTALSAANVAPATDVLAIVDTSATETKKITAKDLIDGALNGGTANGVLYLNGSKVATSGSALQFSGTKLSLSAAGGSDFVGVFTNTTAATPYILRIQEPATPTSGYPLLDVVNNAGSTAYFRVDSGTGNVGIGTASPAYKLDVAGAMQSSVASGNGAIYVNNSSLSGKFWTFIPETSSGESNLLLYYGGTGAGTKLTLTNSGNLGLGASSAASNYSGSYTSLLVKGNSTNKIGTVIAQSFGTTNATNIEMFAGDGVNEAGLLVKGASTAMTFYTGSVPDKRMTLDASGNLLVGTTSAVQFNTSTVTGWNVNNAGQMAMAASATTTAYFNRLTDDGTIISLRQDGAEEGTISVSGNTVSYNAFAGSHWSQLQDGSKPDILRGTVMESINELCVWPGEQNERLPKSKISDTAGSKKVYGVFMAWDNDWTETNDMYVTAVGAFICRVNGSVTVEEGNLLESNGDGTARVQADDIIRSSTIGKVTSTVKTHQYDDGSYCVPTVLYCG